MRDHDAPAGGLGVEAGLDGLGDGADLVDLEEEGVAGLLLDGHGDTSGVGDQEIITDDLDLLADGLTEEIVGLPVILIEGILDGDDGEVVDELLVELDHLLLGSGITAALLELEVVLAVLVELRGSAVHGDSALRDERRGEDIPAWCSRPSRWPQRGSRDPRRWSEWRERNHPHHRRWWRPDRTWP